ncbi:histidine phosphatase family protein [Phenylobacterium sp.]|uniref:histidine phosphatase family protein n=1 Tax=Phenylobacterium sp. TaxID=1871053 RepID=UPI002810A55B|nr:histidine phosphatase family protein [Phenylobacterium sp.]
MIRTFTFVLALALPISVAEAQTVVVVRHAEKADGGHDPDLSSAGHARAQALAQALKGARLTHVLTTPLKRTQQTAAPAAQAAGVAVTPMALGGGAAAHVARVAAAARQTSVDGTVLIVGHSNTVPEIARALGDAAPEPLTECDYDRLTIIQLGGPAPKTIHARYGAPTEACAAKP